PTYNLIHEYPVPTGTIYHMDLYRLNDPQELQFLGVKDLWAPDSLFLIEWPGNGEGFLPASDFNLSIERPDGAKDDERVIMFDAEINNA
ncbi:MAG: tRNA (adenosine(37)-N6)-threonylcarbamoyltransferase complex ATPase subunit type 1 TsaE, partial [Gammaproteobacteria bacterium]|nr:tRNA (adenosine(37)-N6)-threonylcarbamoyltransferase complex ATPase subunit type 1 TsaE [Gammaproteobacteria bacterium]